MVKIFLSIVICETLMLKLVAVYKLNELQLVINHIASTVI